MSDSPAAATASASGAMVEVPIERLSGENKAALSAYFDGGPAYPAILTDVITSWPAYGTWSIASFADRYGDLLGLIPMTFADAQAGKAVSLKHYWQHIDDPIEKVPGFWMDDQGQPTAAPSQQPTDIWSYAWHPFREFPELFEEIEEYPDAFGNLVPKLSEDLRAVLERIADVDLYSIYMSRKDTITPFHLDFHGTIGSLAQYEGEKVIALMEGSASYPKEADGFDPEHPDFDRFPALRGREMYNGILKPGEVLIIPPNWWHYVRSLSHTVTLSHNFFTAKNIDQFLAGLFGDIARLEPGEFRRLMREADEKRAGTGGSDG